MHDIPIFVINLDRSPGRLAHVAAELERQNLAFTRIPAVDAQTLSPEAIAASFDAERSRRSYYAPMHPGEIACFLSHRQAWRTFLDTSDAPFAVILEDDFSLAGDLKAIIAALATENLPPWDMVKLWTRQKGGPVAVARLDDGHRLVRHRVLPTLSIGQVVSRAAAEKLLARTLPIHRPLDVQFQYWWELGIDVLSVDPSVVVDASRGIGGSDLARAAGGGFLRKVRREIGRPLFRLTLQAKSAYYAWRRGRER